LPASLPVSAAERIVDDLHAGEVLSLETIQELCDRNLIRLRDGSMKYAEIAMVVRRYAESRTRNANSEASLDEVNRIAAILREDFSEHSEMMLHERESWSANLWFVCQMIHESGDGELAVELA